MVWTCCLCSWLCIYWWSIRLWLGFTVYRCTVGAFQWRHHERDGVSNHRRLDCLLIRLFRCRSKKAPKLHVAGLCKGNSPVTGEKRASNAEKVSILWRHHGYSRNAVLSYNVSFHVLGLQCCYWLALNNNKTQMWGILAVLMSWLESQSSYNWHCNR